MTLQPVPTSELSKKNQIEKVATDRIEEYEKLKEQNKVLYYTSQVVIILLTGITPLLVFSIKYPVIPAICSSLASITAGLSAAFKFRDKYELDKNCSEALKIEFQNFDLDTGRYYCKGDDLSCKTVQQTDKNHIFMHQIEIIHQIRMKYWMGIMSTLSSSDSETKTAAVPQDIPDLKGVDFGNSQYVNFLNLTQIKSAHNWDKANYAPALRQRLGLDVQKSDSDTTHLSQSSQPAPVETK